LVHYNPSLTNNRDFSSSRLDQRSEVSTLRAPLLSMLQSLPILGGWFAPEVPRAAPPEPSSSSVPASAPTALSGGGDHESLAMTGRDAPDGGAGVVTESKFNKSLGARWLQLERKRRDELGEFVVDVALPAVLCYIACDLDTDTNWRGWIARGERGAFRVFTTAQVAKLDELTEGWAGDAGFWDCLAAGLRSAGVLCVAMSGDDDDGGSVLVLGPAKTVVPASPGYWAQPCTRSSNTWCRR